MIRKTKSRVALLFLAVSMPIAFVALRADAQDKYAEISPPQPVSSNDKVEVIEVFSYGCIHCAHFQPYVDAYLKRLDPKKVDFLYLPATFRPDFALLARGFYAAQSLGLAKATHQGVFNAIFEKGVQIRTFDDIVAMYQQLGVNRDDFLKAAQSFAVETKVRRANDLMRAYKIDGTPTIVVEGKYSVTGDTAGSVDKVFDVVDELVAKEWTAKHKK